MDINVLLADLDSYVKAMRDPLNTFGTDLAKVSRGTPSFGTLPEGETLKDKYSQKQQHLFAAIDAFGQVVTGFSSAVEDVKKAYKAAEDNNTGDAELLLAVQQAFSGVNGILDKQADNAQVLG